MLIPWSLSDIRLIIPLISDRKRFVNAKSAESNRRVKFLVIFARFGLNMHVHSIENVQNGVRFAGSNLDCFRQQLQHKTVIIELEERFRAVYQK